MGEEPSFQACAEDMGLTVQLTSQGVEWGGVVGDRDIRDLTGVSGKSTVTASNRREG